MSIVIPVYNTKDYIKRCVDSVLAQSERDFEILLIDDGSTDGSSDICDLYSQLDSRVHVFHKKNGGASSARNVGLDNVKGEWVCFVDSDDYVNEFYLKMLLFEVGDDVDFVLQKSIRIQGEKFVGFKKRRYIGKDGIKKFFEDGFLSYTTPHSKLYRFSIIKRFNIFFPIDVKIGEDFVFLSEYIRHTNGIVVSNKSGYYYLNDNLFSLSNSFFSPEKEMSDYLKMRQAMICFTSSLGISFEHPSVWRILSPRLRRYIFIVCLGERERAVCQLKKIPMLDMQKYGSGVSCSFKGKWLMFLVNKSFLNILYVYVYIGRKIALWL